MIRSYKNKQTNFGWFSCRLISCFVVFLSLICSIDISAQLDTATVRTFGGDFSEEGRQVIECTSGGYCVIGTTGSDEVNGTNIYLLRTDEDLNCVWSKSIGGLQADKGYSLVENDAGGFVLCGYTNSLGNGGFDVLVYQVDAMGEVEWIKTFGGIDWDFGYKIIRYPGGGYLICGETYSLGNGSTDGYFLHISDEGALITEWTFGWEGEDEFVDVDYWSSSEGDRIILTGNTKSADASALWKGWILSLDYDSGIGESYYQYTDTTNVKMTSSQIFNDKLNYSGNRDIGQFVFGIRGFIDYNLNYLDSFELTNSDSFRYNETIGVGDTIVIAGGASYAGAGGEDASIYFWQDWNFIGAPSFGSTANEVLYSGVFSSDSSLVCTGMSESLNEAVNPQLLLIKITHVISGDYVQNFYLADDCFTVSKFELNSNSTKAPLLNCQYLDISGRVLLSGVENIMKLDEAFPSGIYIARKEYEDGRVEISKFFH
jgi:hypothetical protein